ncbi:dTDP-3-amino-3,4,6-trideoxy-alpha-D-glucopyranose [Poriferisphaera corsica]|uniref:dTDP-3-amino-3,4, 6-trideoxy-alpha-D-glucopyranose n=1 Tax=Poriferisphaera corsica TaxID=2528020 RepID=A0A517YWZ6_9BACT|nr:class I SAM-dependent methyltransferase [Poriferisphaera corsica]QDU34736.1 dTDP-3-amino-3,4,6-trideoxy-alpha-D-glucopyranose [Poriferisphaera corsica]
MTSQSTLQNDWFASYYNTEYADSVKDLLSSELTKREIDFILKTTNLPTRASIADLGCGQGRHAIELAKRGHHLTAIDLNSDFIREAKQTANQSNLQINFLATDMRQSIKPSKPYNLILSLFNSFGFFSDPENQNLIKNWTNHLAPEGFLIIDIWNRDNLIRNFQPHRTHQPNPDLTVTEDATLDTLAGRINRQYTYTYSDNRTKTYQTSFRLYTPAELKAIIEAAGLYVHAIHGNLLGQDYSLDTPRLVMIARKQPVFFYE